MLIRRGATDVLMDILIQQYKGNALVSLGSAHTFNLYYDVIECVMPLASQYLTFVFV